MKVERDDLGLAMLAAWLNVQVDQIPHENRAHLNPHTMAAWQRVGEAAFNAGLERGAVIADELGGVRERSLDNQEFSAQHTRAKTIATAIRAERNGNG